MLIKFDNQYGMVAQWLEHRTGITESWVQSPAGSLLLIRPCDYVTYVWNLTNSYNRDAASQTTLL
jgi:hypothetical protein